MKYAKNLDRRDLILAVWAAEFTRSLGSGTTQRELGQGAPVLRLLVERAAASADSAVEALRLLLDVEFRLASAGELDACYMTWDKFVACCQGGALTDDDGHGELATGDHYVSNVRVQPSDAISDSYRLGARPAWATHVCWYNK